MKKAIRTETGTDKIFGMLCTCLKYGDNEDDELLFSLPYMQNNGYFKGIEFEQIN